MSTPTPPSSLVSEPQLQAMLDGVRAQGQRRWSRHLRSSVRRGAEEEQLHGLVERVLQSELRQPSAQKCQKRLTVDGGKLRVYCQTFFQSEPRSEQVQSLLV